MATASATQAILYIGPNSGAASSVSETTAMEVSISTDTVEDTAHGDTFRTYLLTLSDFELSFTRNYDDSAGGGAVQKYVIDRTLLKFYVYPVRTTATIYWYGTGYLTGGGMTLGLEDVIASEFSLTPAGAIGYIHP